MADAIHMMERSEVTIRIAEPDGRTHARRRALQALVAGAALTAGAMALPAVVVARTSAEAADDGVQYVLPVPPGLDRFVPVPPDNPLTPEKVALGRRLFFDPVLSEDQSLSCATCHVPERAFAGDVPVAEGIGGRRGRRNAPSLLNRAFGEQQFWDGRVATLEEQALEPIASEHELGSSAEAAVARLSADESYREAFGQVFADGVTAANLARALAAYQRTLLSGDSPNDRFTSGDFNALSDAARTGRWIFESSGQCWRCHSGPNFTDDRFHNTGVSWGSTPLDLGRFEVTGAKGDEGAFRTPGLRGVAKSGPYMHDGSIATLREVVEFYRRGGEENPHLDPLMRPLDLTDDEVTSLVAFLESLTGQVEGEVELEPAAQDDGEAQ